ncbi:unnamed protein product [Euphydryas editha]|uniref:HTH CENPB-type domain-containing protein n=1 Tax=Euphydryas editha TaxID=104508 RepID=A0AAU9VFD7_EUPED|nr:unnamed protein product [Euphydryas editha]
MPPTKGNFRNYTQEAMEAAVEDVRLHKTPYKTAAKKFNVPRITLKAEVEANPCQTIQELSNTLHQSWSTIQEHLQQIGKVEGKHPIDRKMGPPAVLSRTEEKTIVDWIFEMARAGFPVTMKEVVFSVQRLLTELKRPNPFKDNCPGKSWMKGFMKRNPGISVRMSQNLTRSRAVISKEKILNWFKEVETFLDQTQQKDVLQDPRRIFNTDETIFFLNPKGGKVLAQKGDKTVYQQVNPDEKECLTVLITEFSIPEWGLGKTDSGWMTCEAFFEFIADIFHPWLKKESIPLPVILFVDGHASHLSLQVSQFCEKNGIILIALYPNATHLLQPMDVAVFRTLKEHWKKRVHEWRISNLEAPILKKKDFPKLLKEVIDTTLNATIFENGFRKCGLFPWHPEIVTVPLKNEHLHNQVTNVEGRRRFLEEGLRFLNQSIPQSKLIIFCNGDKNELDEKDISLFELWQSTKSEIENGLPNSSVVIPEPTAENSEDINLLFNIIPLASGGNNEWQNQSTAHNNRPSKNNSPTIFESYFENNMNLCQAGPSSAPAVFPSPFAPDALPLASGAICQAGPSSAPAVFLSYSESVIICATITK